MTRARKTRRKASSQQLEARGSKLAKARRRKRAKSAAQPMQRTEAAVEAIRQQLQRRTPGSGPMRWNASPEDVQRSVMQLVLTLVEFIRKLLERQAIRRMEGHTLTKKETENVGLALMRLEETIRDLAAQFGLEPEDLNLDLGPVGKLM